MSLMTKLLLAEDDELTISGVVDVLTRERIDIDVAMTGTEAREKLLFYGYDIIILDWGLPGVSGPELCKEIRDLGIKTPVLMLTGKGSITDKEEGFSSGADDYLTKPFHTKELVLRVQALLRRPQTYLGDTLQCGNIILDSKAKRVTKDGNVLRLRPKEYDLLEFLMRHKGTIFSAEAIFERVWSSESESANDAIFTCMKRLRQQIDDEKGPSIIKTVRGSGYVIDADD